MRRDEAHLLAGPGPRVINKNFKPTHFKKYLAEVPNINPPQALNAFFAGDTQATTSRTRGAEQDEVKRVVTISVIDF